MGNFSRSTFNEHKHYVGVRLQQGVPIVDADWNEMEDIRRHEQRLSLKLLVGDGVPAGEDDAFSIKVLLTDNNPSKPVLIDFAIGKGSCFVDGQEVVNDLGQEATPLTYTAQRLYQDDDLAKKWDVPVLPALTTLHVDHTAGITIRLDAVYLDVWEREVNSDDEFDAEFDPPMVNPDIGIETCVRLRREWVVRVREGFGDVGDDDPGKLVDILKQDGVCRDHHAYLILAWLVRLWTSLTGEIPGVVDLRRMGLAVLSRDITIKDGNVGIGTVNPDRKLTIDSVPYNQAALSITSQAHNTSQGMIFINSLQKLEPDDDKLRKAHRLLTARKRDWTHKADLDWTFEIQKGDEPALAFWRAYRPDGGAADFRFPLTLGWNGNVGIGPKEPHALPQPQTAPEAKLHILNQEQDATNGNTLILGPTSSSNLRLGYHADYSWIQSHGSKPLAINPLGNKVGIGTSDPKGALDVAGGYIVMRSAADNEAASALLDELPNNTLIIGGDWTDEGNNPGIYFYWKDRFGKKCALRLEKSFDL